MFVSGQASVDDEGTIIPDTFEEEVGARWTTSFESSGTPGSMLRDVVRVTTYVRDPADGPRHNEIHREYFTDPLPARTILSNCLSPALRFEVDVIAVRS